MDAKFLELLGNILVGSARNKQQSDQFFEWVQSGFSDLGKKNVAWVESSGNELFEMFKSWYGLNDISQKKSEYDKMSEEAFDQFNTSMKESFFSMGFVPRSEHLELVERYEKLKTENAALQTKHKELEETVDHLKMLLQGQSDMTTQFQDMISKQGVVYQEMLQQFSSLFPEPKKDSE